MRDSELTLEEMLADPIVRLMMGRDGVDEMDLRQLLDRMRDRLRGEAKVPAAGASADPAPASANA